MSAAAMAALVNLFNQAAEGIANGIVIGSGGVYLVTTWLDRRRLRQARKRAAERLARASGPGGRLAEFEAAEGMTVCRECWGLGGREVRGGPGTCERCGRGQLQ